MTLLDRDIYFLPSPSSLDYLEVDTCMIVDCNPDTDCSLLEDDYQRDMTDPNGELVPTGSMVLFPY